MATNGKRAGGQFIPGFVFVVTGVVFIIVGKTAAGCAMLGVGLGLVIGGVMAARKAAPPVDSTGTPPPAVGETGRS